MNRRAAAWAVLAVAVAATSIAGWVLLRGGDGPRTLRGSVVASIVFGSPTDAWVSTTGTKVLFDDGQLQLADFDAGGRLGSYPVDEVSVLDDHRLYELSDPTPVLVIDQTEYSLVDGVYVSGECHWCKVPYPDQPVLADLHDGTWKVTVGRATSIVRQPQRWDQRPADSRLDPDGRVVVLARRDDGRTAIVDSTTCIVDGTWALVAAEADGVLLHRVDPNRLDYTVARFPRCR
ncbi:MAG: hypothetical protein WCC60_07315 [Ilumatobacteraceae bacterium]